MATKAIGKSGGLSHKNLFSSAGEIATSLACHCLNQHNFLWEGPFLIIQSAKHIYILCVIIWQKNISKWSCFTKILALLWPKGHLCSFDHQNLVTFHTEGDFTYSSPKKL